jgi:hypothetical protein
LIEYRMMSKIVAVGRDVTILGISVWQTAEP